MVSEPSREMIGSAWAGLLIVHDCSNYVASSGENSISSITGKSSENANLCSYSVKLHELSVLGRFSKIPSTIPKSMASRAVMK